MLLNFIKTLNHIDTVGVPGSNPGVPTSNFKGSRFMTVAPFFFW